MAQLQGGQPGGQSAPHRRTGATSRVPGPMRTPFLVFVGVLFVLTGALLAIACSNVAGMLLGASHGAAARDGHAPGHRRQPRPAGRASCSPRPHCCSVAAGVVAVPLTAAGVRLVNASLPALPIALNLALTVNGRVVAFALGMLARHGARLRPGAGPPRARPRPGAAAPWRRGHRRRRRPALRHAAGRSAGRAVADARRHRRPLRAHAGAGRGGHQSRVHDRRRVLANLDVSLAGFRGPAAVDLVQRLQTRVAALPGVTGGRRGPDDSPPGQRLRPGPATGAGYHRTGRRRHRRCRLERRDARVLRRGPNADRRRPRPARRRPRRSDTRRRGQRDLRAYGLAGPLRRRPAPAPPGARRRRDVARSRGSSRRREVPLHQRRARAVPVRADGAASDRRRHAVRRSRPGRGPTRRYAPPWPRWSRACR